MILIEIAPGTTIDQVKENTEAEFKIAKDLKVMDVDA